MAVIQDCEAGKERGLLSVLSLTLWGLGSNIASELDFSRHSDLKILLTAGSSF